MTASEQAFPVTEAYRGMRLDRFLQAMVPRMSRTAIQDAITHRVRLASGAEPKASRKPAVGDVVFLAQREAVAVPEFELQVLAEGDGWTVIHKPAGIASIPNARRPGADIATLTGKAPAHRLDFGTSGCLLLVHSQRAARHFEAAFRERRIHKQYLAVIAGSPQEDALVIDAPIALDPNSRLPHKVWVTQEGAAAVTHVQVLERHAQHTLVAAQPQTGRRHQIRAHLAHIGHAILGDLLYGGDERQFIRWLQGQPVVATEGVAIGRHLLHAHRLQMPLPDRDETIVVEAPLPDDFAR